MSAEPLALYVHWPFCVSKCPYCDFNSHVRASIDQDAWREALLADLAHEARLLPGPRADFDLLRRRHALADGAGDRRGDHRGRRRALDAADDIEITLEANPNSVEAARFADLAAAGVNRVSLGLQSFDDAALAFLGRAHSAARRLAALEIAQKNFRAGQLRSDLRLARRERRRLVRELAQALSLGTVASLALPADDRARHALRERWRHAASFEPLDADAAAALYELTDAMTSAAGMPAYEISNHARPGQREPPQSHLLALRRLRGVGPGAHGRRLGMRTVRHKKPENFLSALRRNGHGIGEEEPLLATEAADEALVMGLRLTEGIDAGAIARRFGLESIVDWQRVDRLVAFRPSDPATASASP